MIKCLLLEYCTIGSKEEIRIETKKVVTQLVHDFSEIFKAIHQRSYHKLANANLYPGQPQLLLLIRDNDGITQKALSEKHCVKPATITGMLSKLEANHYVRRVPDEEDKRIMRVYLTPAGRCMAEQGDAFMKGLTNRLFDGFTDEELETMHQMVLRIKDNLNNKSDDLS